MKIARYDPRRVRTAIWGLAIVATFWVVAFTLSVPLNARWPQGFPEIDIPRNALSPFLGGKPHPPVYQAAQATWEAWVWFATLVTVVTFLWVKVWMMWHFTQYWHGLEKSVFAIDCGFLVVYLRAVTASLYPTFGRDATMPEFHVDLWGHRIGWSSFDYQFWLWSQRGAVWLLLALLVWGIFQMLLIDDVEERPMARAA